MNTTPVRPMIDDFELPLVQALRTEESQVWVEHGVPALEGSLFQHLGRSPARVLVYGVMADDESLGKLERLRQIFQEAEPVPFVADITTATEVTQVLIADLAVREVAGKPQQYHYCLTLVEFVPTPEPIEPPPPPPPPPPEPCDQGFGSIEVRVELPPGQTDMSGIVVRVQRVGAEGEPPIEITAPDPDGVFRRQNVPVGDYRAMAFRR
ncbi:MAG TPA: hypothetical protein VNL77_22705 [Roseiflexaceae bacterium]|nr:hypothetical protein [Roseiflexaceae bacterium]